VSKSGEVFLQEHCGKPPVLRGKHGRRSKASIANFAKLSTFADQIASYPDCGFDMTVKLGYCPPLVNGCGSAINQTANTQEAKEQLVVSETAGNVIRQSARDLVTEVAALVETKRGWAGRSGPDQAELS